MFNSTIIQNIKKTIKNFVNKFSDHTNLIETKIDYLREALSDLEDIVHTKQNQIVVDSSLVIGNNDDCSDYLQINANNYYNKDEVDNLIYTRPDHSEVDSIIDIKMEDYLSNIEATFAEIKNRLESLDNEIDSLKNR